MYSINHKHKDNSTEYSVYIAGDRDYCLTYGKLSLEMGKAGELSIEMPMTNPAVDQIECLTDEIIVYRDGVEMWRGRPITSQQDFELTGTLICEGVLAYLYDTVYPPFEYQGKPEDLLKAVVNNHNSFVNNDKKFTVGNITVADKNDYINRSSVDYLKSIEVLSSRFVESSLGGYFRVRIQGGVKYLDYLEDYDSTATQNVEFGENILDLATEIEYGDAITAILPLGARIDEETGEKLTVKSVNGGDIYVRDAGLISSRGFIAEVVEWEDVTEASNLLTKARNYLSQASTFIQTFTIKAIDLHYADSEIEAFNLGDAVRVVSEAHGVNQYSELYKASFDLLDPSNDSYEFGITRTNNSLTGRAASTQRNIKDSVSNLTVNFHKINADYASIDYLSANYATITQLDAEHAHIVDLQADVAQIDTALINKADIADLTAANAHITDLEADYANIHTLLSGNAGIGDLQTIHLTSQNSVIDVAMIRNLLAQNITVNDLLAGDIITNRQRIISNDGSFVIDGSTQSIYDENGNIRIQIGRDANDEFTFVLYDENGTGVLLDAEGIHESAIGDGLIKDSMVANNANIQATKLDIASLFTAMNEDGVNTLYANKIWFDDQNQTLTQLYTQTTNNITQISSDLSDVEDTADSAYSMAEAATRAADQATRALEGITSLDNLTAILSNDAHVVHTYHDGTGGDYTYARTQVYAYKGDTDVTARSAISVYNVSAGLAGTWDANNKVYQVTAMTALNGYVDFEISYGTKTDYITTPDGKYVLTPDGKRVKTNSGAAKVYKRFSISKSPDGMAGTTWNLYSSVGVIRRSQDGLTLSPSTITFSARKTVGEVISTYSGKYKIEETVNLTTWVQRYYSSDVEETKVYTPSVSARMIRCTLMDENGNFLDSQTVTVIADADELNDALIQAQSAIQSVSTRVGTVETGINGLRVDLGEMETQIHGMAAGNLLFQTPYTLNEAQTIYTFNAKVYKEGEDVHTDYPRSWFQWFRRTESGTTKLGTGYSVSVNKNTLGYGATIIGRFSTFEDASRVVTPDGKYVLTPDGNYVTAYGKPVMQFDVETNVYQDDAIISRFKTIDTQFDVTLGKISSIISDSEITQYNSGSTMNTKLSALVQDVDGLHAQFSSMETTQEGTISRVTQLEADVDGISSSVVYTDTYNGQTIASLINQSASTVTINASHINLTGYVTMTNLQTAGQTTINGANLTTGIIKDSSGNTTWNLSTGALSSKKLSITSTNFKLTESGVITATSGTIGGWTITSSTISSTSSGLITGLQKQGSGTWAFTVGATTNSNWGTGKFRVNHSGKMYAEDASIEGGDITTYSSNYTTRSRLSSGRLSFGTRWGSSYKENAYLDSSGDNFNIWTNREFQVFPNTFYLSTHAVGSSTTSSAFRVGEPSETYTCYLYGKTFVSNLTVQGSKSRIVKTEDYSERLLYCYETPSPLFGDVGEGEIGEGGLCHIWLDPIFAETISTDQYQVFLQKYGDGDCCVSERHPNYFVVKGTEGLAFGWELKAKQSDFDQYRLEKEVNPNIVENNDYAGWAQKHVEELKEGRFAA